MIRNRYLWIALAALAALNCLLRTHRPAQAQTPSGYAPAPSAPLSAGNVDIAFSRIYVHVDKTGFGHEHGVESLLRSGHVQLSATENAGELVFDMTSFQADTDQARRAVGLDGSSDPNTRKEVNANMLGPDVLDVRRYPTAVFRINSIQAIRSRRPNAAQQFRLDGEFTLHGTTNKITITATATNVDRYTHLVGDFSILQSDYGIKPFRKALGAVGVADQLTIYGDLWIAR